MDCSLIFVTLLLCMRQSINSGLCTENSMNLFQKMNQAPVLLCLSDILKLSLCSFCLVNVNLQLFGGHLSANRACHYHLVLCIPADMKRDVSSCEGTFIYSYIFPDNFSTFMLHMKNDLNRLSDDFQSLRQIVCF